MQKRQKISKHDKYVLELRDKLAHKYDSLSLNVKIAGRKRSLGEVDIMARKGNRIDLYEVKCSHRIVKAKKQLKKVKRILNLDSSRSFFYCGSSGLIVSV